MKGLLKNLGIILVLIGVVVFVAYSLTSTPSNNYLIAGGALVVIGIIGHVILNKFIQD